MGSPRPVVCKRSAPGKGSGRRPLRGHTLLFSLALALLGLSSQGSPGLATPIPLASADGMAMLSTSDARADYGALAQELVTQATLTYCGVASSVMVLNSLAMPAPVVPGYGSYRFWTQDNLWMGIDSDRVVSANAVRRRGMTLQELSALLQGHGLQVERIHGQDLDLNSFRRRLRESLANPADRLLVNYNRPEVGQKGGGHIAPLAAYHAGRDQVLILDVSRYRYPTVWVPVRDLWLAIRRIDDASGLSRGLVLVQPARPTDQP